MENHTNPFEIRAAMCVIGDRAGFLGAITALMARFQVHIICFDADRLSGIKHVKSAVERAMRSFDQGYPISKTIEMEALLYASGSRQTSIGSSLGIHVGKNNLYICCYPGRDDVWHELGSLVRFCDCEDPWCEIDPRKRAELMRFFEVTEEELETTVDRDLEILILERVALLDVSR
jgi:KEOPS complex subunit Cgi121